MKRFSFLFVAVLTGALIIATSVSALVLNGNFESGTFGSWTKSTFTNNGFSSAPGGGGTDLSSIVGGPAVAPLSLSDPRTNNVIQYPGYGHYSAKVNDERSYSGGGFATNGNKITQDVAAYIDPTDNLAHTKFAYTAVMVNPTSHTPNEKPYYRVRAINTSNGNDVLYDFSSYVDEPGKNWIDGAAFGGGENWKYLNWQVIDLTPTPAHPVVTGNIIRIEVSAAGCSLGGHPGYVYVDEITDNEIAGPTITASGPSTVVSGSSITYNYNYRNGSTSVINPTVTVTQPAGVTFTSVSDTTNCTLSGGTVTCNFTGMAPVSNDNFTITGNVTAAGGTQLAHGNYTIGATGFPTVGGQTVLTNVTAFGTTTSVTSSVNPSVFGQNVTFTATVAPTSGSATPTGNVQFVVDGSNFGAPVALVNGVAQISTAGLAVGNHPVVANYAGVTAFGPSSGSLAGGQTVTKAATSTSVSTSGGTSTYGQNVTFTATVAVVGPGTGTPGGTVSFFYGATPIPGCQNVSLNASGQAQCSIASLPAGTHVITASYSGNGSYNGGGATTNQVVNKANLGVTASSHTVTYGDAAPGVTPMYSGFVLGENPTALTTAPSCSTTYASGSAVSGSPYSTSCSGGSASNYNFVFTNGTTAVNRATVNVTASSHTVTFGDTAPTITPAYSGFVLGEGAGVLTSTPACSTTYTAGSSASGSPYSSSCNGAAAGNYNFTYASGTVAVQKSMLVVTASSHPVVYGGNAPSVTPSYAGFVLAQGPANLTTQPTCSTAYSSGSQVANSPYSTGCSGGVSNNYDFTYVSGSVTVSTAQLNVTASSHNVTYGDAAPAVTPAYAGFVLGEDPTVLATAPSCSTSYASGSAVAGSPYSTSCAGGVASNYNFVYTNGLVGVNTATVTITASSHNVTFGDAAPTITPAYAGFVLGQGPADLTNAPSCSTTYTSGSSAVGSPYPSNCGGAEAANYNFTYTNGSVTVGKMPLVVTASSHAAVYGENAPAITPSYSGFVISQGPGDLITQPTCITNYAAGSSVGGSPYSTSCSGGASNNYDFTYLNGTVAVTTAPLSVTASSHTVTYGDAAPTISPAYAGFVLGEDPADLSTQPTCATAYSPGSNVVGSPYVTNCSGAAAANYSLSYTDGSVAVNKAPLTVTAPSLNLSFGDGVPLLSAIFSGFVLGENSSNLLAIPVCTTTYLAGSPLSGSPYPTSCSSGGSNNYQITYVNGAITMASAVITVTASSHTVNYGAAVPVITPSYSGFAPGQTAANLTAVPTCTTVYSTGSAASATPYVTSCSGASSPDYAFNYVDGGVTVNKAPLQVVSPSLSLSYGDALPALTPTYAGFVLGQGTVALATPPVCSTAYTAGTNAGGAPVSTNCSGGVAANYAFVYVPGQITVAKKALTVTADDKARPYGSANPALTSSFSGFAVGQTLATSGVTGSPQLSTTAVPPSPVSGSPYPISVTVGSLQSTNYSFVFVNGGLTVQKAVVTVAANNAGRIYGSPNPAFTASYSGFVNGEVFSTSGVVGNPAFDSPATQFSPVGQYPLGVSGGTLSAPNYQFAFVDGILTVSKAPTSTTITNGAALARDRTRVGESYTVNFTTVPLAPATGILTGTVTITDGTGASCTAAVLAGNCSMISTTPGKKALTASYSGDDNFFDSESFDNYHTVVLIVAGNVRRQLVNGSENMPGVLITILGSVTGEAITDANGNYSFTSVTPSGSYLVRASGQGMTFEPTSRAYSSVTDNLLDVNFVGQGGPGATPSPTPYVTPSPTPAVTPSPTPSTTPTPVPSPTPGNGIGGEGDVVDANGSSAGGDGVTESDLDQIRKFARGEASPDSLSNQFQRADTSPRDPAQNMFGDGIIDSSDVTVARLYSLGMLPGTTAAGPVLPDTSATPTTNVVTPRRIRVVDTSTRPGETVAVQFQIDAQGDESSASFTLRFDPTVFLNPVVTVGSGVSEGTNLSTNVSAIAEGKIGVLVDSVTAYSAGVRQLVTIRFNVAPDARLGLYPVTFENGPTGKSVSNNAGVLMPSRFETGYIQVGSTAAGVTVTGRLTNAAGQGIRNAIVTMTDPSGNRRTALTGSFGIYRFDDVAVGATYVVAPSSRRYRFTPQLVNVADSIAGLDFVGRE